MRSEIISVGTELMLGNITDTNASFIAGRLPLLGADLLWVTQVGDNMGRLTEALERAWGRSELIITTGGLGPTEDDLTRQGIARSLGEQLYVDQELEKWVRGIFSSRGAYMPERNIQQAMLIPSAKAIPNPFGTAPGWWVEKGGRVLVAMPGVPREMVAMWEKEVTPRLKALLGETVILSRTFKTLGISEAGVDEMLGDLLHASNPSIGVYAKQDGIHVRLTAKAQGQAAAEALLAPAEAKVRAVFGPAIWGVDDDTLEATIGALLKAKGLTLAVMESCTGGLLSNTITDIPGSSAYFKGGIVSYSNEMKIASGVPEALVRDHGAVSAEVAKAMAGAVRKHLGADIGVGVTGVAGPETLEGKPAGTVFFCIDNGRQTFPHQGRYPPRRLDVKRWAVLSVFNQLRRVLLNVA